MKHTLAGALIALASVAAFAQTSPSTAASAGIPGTKPASAAADKGQANVQKRDDKKAGMGHAGKASKAASSASDAAANSGK